MGLISRFMQRVASAADQAGNNEFSASETPGFAFLDVETPNRHNDRICSIGIIRTDLDGAVMAKSYMLINPEEPFDQINTSIHGISESDVSGCVNFAEAWPRIDALIENAVVIAHNASFDLTVLDKCLTGYGIPMRPLTYACTKQLAGSHLHNLQNLKLKTVCNSLGITLSAHHNAMADANACMQVFFAMPGLDMSSESWKSEYIPHAEREARRSFASSARKSETTKAQNRLIDLCSAVIEDGRVSTSEAADLYELIKANDNLNGEMEKNLLELLSLMLEDGTIDPCEEAELLDTLGKIVNPMTGDLTASCDICGKKFCLTGDFDCGSRDDVTAILEAAGGIPCKSVVKTCDYVIVGSKGSEAYAFGSYGTKVKKAMEWQAKGQPVQIVSELDFADVLMLNR